VGQQGYKGERNRIRLSIASTRTNALGLGIVAAVILLVGASQIGLEAWRHHTAEKAPQSTSGLEELLQRRLPTPEIQQSQHQAIVNAIRDWRPGTVPVPIDDETIRADLLKFESRIENLEKAATERFTNVNVPKWVAWLVVISLCGAGVFLGFRTFAETDRSKRVLEFGAAAALTIPSIFGGLELATHLKVDFALIKNDGGLHPGSERGGSRPPPTSTEPRDVDVYLHLDVGRGPDALPAAMDCGDDDKQQVGPFDVGKVTVPTKNRSAEAVVAELKARVSGKPDRLTAIILIGSADKRSLKPGTAALYSSNAGLARARIEVVKTALGKVFEKNKPPVLQFYAGPEKTSAKLLPKDLSADRTVQVCVLWDSKP
jgi:hypothetical protein